jgi:hypothetical protein
VIARLPQNSFLFSWTLGAETRGPAGVVQSGNDISVRGRSLYSFEDGYSLIDAGETIVKLDRAGLNSSQRSQLDHFGKTVHIRVPKGTVSLVWAGRPSD